MDDNAFWIKIVQAFVALSAVVSVTIGGCTAYESKRIADAVDAGKDPIAARCGIAGTHSTNSAAVICAARATVTR